MSRCLLIFLAIAQSLVYADNSSKGTKLVYLEREQGVDPYYVTYTVTSDFIRIDDASDTSGYIVFNVLENKIYSVSHYDKSILIIPEYRSDRSQPDVKTRIEYSKMEDAPTISGKPVYNYRVSAESEEDSSVCMDIQLVPDLLPEVASVLQKFQALVSGQHVYNLDNTPSEYHTPCYLVDQVFNTGEYYEKGLPIREWHSNERMRQLVNFEAIDVNPAQFIYPLDYRQYSLK
jgi:hypothetical protein